MRTFLAILGILVTLTVNAQSVTRKGYYNAHMGDSIGLNRTTADKAILDCYGMSQNNPDGKEIYYTGPDRWVVAFPVAASEPQFLINSITEKSLTSSSIVIEIEFNTDDLKAVYIRFRAVGGVWQRTTDDPADVHWIGVLDSGTEYEYMVYAENAHGTRINSDLLTFTTL